MTGQETVGQTGEFALIERIRQVLDAGGGPASGVAVGIGDDAAVLSTEPGWELLVTCDVQVEGRHYLPDAASRSQLGYRAMAVNLSDIAAMGGEARYALVSLGLRAGTRVDHVEELYRGFLEALTPHRAAVVGGNVSRVDGAEFIDVTLIGRAETGTAVRRDGARPGDAILASGHPGQAAAGLRLLRDSPAGADLALHPLVQAYLRPEARLREARALVRTGSVHAMIDTSDGFLGDLGHLCADSRVGARLRADDLPVSPQLRQAATAWGLDPLELCLAPSDDYELVLTCPPEAGPALAQAWSALTRVPLTAVGVVTAERGKVELIGADGHPRRLQAAGWDHFG